MLFTIPSMHNWQHVEHLAHKQHMFHHSNFSTNFFCFGEPNDFANVRRLPIYGYIDRYLQKYAGKTKKNLVVYVGLCLCRATLECFIRLEVNVI